MTATPLLMPAETMTIGDLEVAGLARARLSRAEGSASDEAQPSEENRRADEGGHR